MMISGPTPAASPIVMPIAGKEDFSFIAVS